MAAAELIPLVNIIKDAVVVVIDEYDSKGKVFPSLQSTMGGPFDSAASVTPALANAVKTIEAACAQLSISVARPAHAILNVSS